MNYHDFTLLVRERVPGEYLVEARSLVRGEARGTLTLDSASPELAGHLERLEAGTTDESSLKEFGSLLFDALFHGAVRDLFYRSLGHATAAEKRGVRIKLDLEPGKMAFLPWEFLYDKGEGCFLATFPLSVLTRYISVARVIRQLETHLPIRALVVIPAASGLNTEKEKGILQEAFSELKSGVQLNVLEGKITPAVLSDALMREHYHILHFIGHGAFVGENAYLFLNTEGGETEPLSANRVAQFFSGYSSLKLVLLNVCQGATGSPRVPMAALADHLVNQGIPAVVAMRYPIPDNAAILFAREFYRKLCIDRDERGRVDAAICHARNQLWIAYPGKRHFGTPVLFLRSPEGIIFDVRAETQGSHALRAIETTYANNLDILEKQQREGEVSPETQAEVLAAREGMKRARKMVRRRNTAVVGVVLLVFIASWIGLLNILGLDERMEQILARLGNQMSPPPWDKSISVVVMDPESRSTLTLTETSDLRRYDARIVSRLAKAGARVIAFDYFYERPSQHDHTLAEAIREAREHGSAVIVGVREVRIEGSRVTPTLIPELREAVSGWGVAKDALGSIAGYVRKMRLMEVGLGDENDVRVHFFGLQVIYHGLQASNVGINTEETLLTLYGHEQREIPILQMTSRETGRPLLFRSNVPRRAEVYIRFSSPENLLQHTVSYQRLLNEPEDSPWWLEFRDKVVLLGDALPGRDQPSVYPGEKRFGIHILADGINTVLQEQYVRAAATWSHVGILLAMGGAAAFLRWRIPPQRKLAGRSILSALSLLYLATALFVYARFLILLDVGYHLIALLLAYWTVGLVRQRLA